MRVWRLVWGILFGVVAIVGATPVISHAEGLSLGSEVQITGIVPARTTLIVDKNNEIQQVFCNADSEGDLTVTQGKLNGPIIPITSGITDQYVKLRPGLKFNYGYIYSRTLQVVSQPKLLPVIEIERSNVNDLVVSRPVQNSFLSLAVN